MQFRRLRSEEKQSTYYKDNNFFKKLLKSYSIFIETQSSKKKCLNVSSLVLKSFRALSPLVEIQVFPELFWIVLFAREE